MTDLCMRGREYIHSDERQWLSLEGSVGEDDGIIVV